MGRQDAYPTRVIYSLWGIHCGVFIVGWASSPPISPIPTFATLYLQVIFFLEKLGSIKMVS